MPLIFPNSAHMGKMKNISTPIFMIDFEGSRKIGVVEYGAVKISGGEIVSARTGICRPRLPIPPRDAQFFGIDNANTLNRPSFSQEVEIFAQMRRDGILASHNSAVEDSLLRDAMPSPGTVPDHVSGGYSCQWGPWLDTLSLCRRIFPGLPCGKLSGLTETLNLSAKLENAAKKLCPPKRRKWHCALYDALAASLILIWICSRDGFGEVSLPWLLKHSGSLEESELF